MARLSAYTIGSRKTLQLVGAKSATACEQKQIWVDHWILLGIARFLAYWDGANAYSGLILLVEMGILRRTFISHSGVAEKKMTKTVEQGVQTEEDMPLINDESPFRNGFYQESEQLSDAHGLSDSRHTSPMRSTSEGSSGKILVEQTDTTVRESPNITRRPLSLSTRARHVEGPHVLRSRSMDDFPSETPNSRLVTKGNDRLRLNLRPSRRSHQDEDDGEDTEDGEDFLSTDIESYLTDSSSSTFDNKSKSSGESVDSPAENIEAFAASPIESRPRTQTGPDILSDEKLQGRPSDSPMTPPLSSTLGESPILPLTTSSPKRIRRLSDLAPPHVAGAISKKGHKQGRSIDARMSTQQTLDQLLMSEEEFRL
jgi:hypothetical protein